MFAGTSDEEMPEEPQSSRVARPGNLWSADSSERFSELVLQQLDEIMARLDNQAEQQLQLEEILQRLDGHGEVLRELLRASGSSRRKSERLEANLLTYETPTPQVADDQRSNSKGRRTSERLGAELLTYETPTPQAVADDQRSTSKKSPTTSGRFKTFTQADMALRRRAAEMDGEINRQRYADGGEGVHSVEAQKEPSLLQTFVEHPAFDSFFAILVIINCVFIAFEVQDSIWNDEPTSVFLMITQYTFTTMYTIELALRFAALGCRGVFLGEDWAWILLDLLIVTSALVEMSLNLAARLMSGGNELGINLQGFKAFRIIRVTRILKTLRLVRVFRFIMALRTLVTSIIYTLKSLFWAMALLMLIVFVFAVLLVEAVSDYWGTLDNPHMPPEDAWRIQAYFASLPHAMLSLFMSISGGVSWEEVIAPLAQISYFWVVIYLFYISFTYFAVLNVVTGVFCQSAIDSAQNDHANVVQSMLANKEAHVEKITELFSRLGANKTGVITYGMFEEGLRTPAVIEYFETLGLDVWDAWSFFKLLDLDAGGSVEIEEFFKGCLRLRGQARGVDLGKLLHDQRWLIKAQGRFQSYVEVKLGEMCDVLDRISSTGTPKLNVKAPSNFMRGISPVNQEERNA